MGLGRRKDNLWLILAFYHVVPRDQTQAIKLGSKDFSRSSHFVSPFSWDSN